MQANGRISKLWVRENLSSSLLGGVMVEIKELEKLIELKKQEILLLCDVIASKMEELEAFKVKLNDLWEGVK